MQKKMGVVVLGTLLGGACGSVLVGGLILMSGTQSALSAPAKLTRSSGWQTVKDARLGFLVSRPAGWTVRADSRSVMVQDPGRRETALMEVFTASPGDSAEAHLNQLAEDHAALFPGAEISDVSPQESKGEEVAASLTYGNGAGQGRALCSVVNGKGLLFVLAAPADSFAADQPVLAHILKSLRFTVPAAHTAASAKGVAGRSAAAVRGLHFVSWTEPHQHGFRVEIPKGWTPDGGVFQTGPTDLRIAYLVTSPAKDMQVIMGDPRLPSTLVTPNEMLGLQEGMAGCMRYMPTPEFNHWYLDTLVRPMVDSLTVVADHPLPEVSRQRTIQAQQMFGNSAEVEVSVGITEFSGVSRVTRKPITGMVIGTTQRMSSPGMGMGGGTTTWVPTVMVLTCNDGVDKARRQQVVQAVFAHLLQSYREDPAWASRESQAGAATGAEHRQELAQTTRSIDAAREASMGAYWGHVNADNERQQGFADYMGDRTHVTGEDGVTHSVQSGSKHYYQGQDGTVYGTDSAYSPGVDFTPLTER